jgi:hypothetical protein
VADAQPPPVAIRITRPYDSEDEYLANELEMTSKTSITLVGAQPRPQGVVLRFELALTGGHVLVRGEGRVVAFKPNVHRGVGGLTLRFTRIDARSKAFLDKATAMREQRRPSSKPPRVADETAPALSALGVQAPAVPTPPESEPQLPPVLTPLPPETAPVVPALAGQAPAPAVPAKPALENTVMFAATDLLSRAPAPPPAPAPAPAPAHAPKPALENTVMFATTDLVSRAPAPVAAPAPPAKPALEHTIMVSAADFSSPPAPVAPATAPAPANRDALLDRLRTRAKGLDPAAVQRILDGKTGLSS